MRTVVAVTEPFAADFPNALTQSPTARADAVVACVSVNVVDDDKVTFRFSALGVVGFVVVLDLVVVGRANEPSKIPDIDTVDPLMAVTFPLPIEKLRPPNPALPLKAPLPLELPLAPPPSKPPGRPPPGKPPLRPAKPPAPNPLRPAVPAPAPVVQVPEEEAVLMTMVFAAIVVFDDLEGVPVTVMQSPTASELAD
jgi:hypothetical protein